MYKVSVVIPVYNGEKYILRCIEALKKQTLENIEIIIINDGSTDNTKHVLEGLSNNKFITVINQENLGPGVARNKGIMAASGEFVAFCDVDDTFDSNMLQSMYDMTLNNKVEVVMCGYKNITGNDKEIYLPEFSTGCVLNKEQIKELIMKKVIKFGGGMYASSCNKIYARQWLIDNDIKFGEDRIYGEDWFFNQKSLGKINKIGFIKEPFYNYYRINKNSIMNSYHSNLFELHLESRQFLIENMKTWGLYNEENLKNADNRFIFKVLESIINEMSRRNKKCLNEKLSYIRYILDNKEVVEAIKNADKNIINKLILKKHSIILAIIAYYRGDIKIRLHNLKKTLFKER